MDTQTGGNGSIIWSPDKGWHNGQRVTLAVSEGRISARCPLHRAYEPDNCPVCGTAAKLGGAR